MNFNNKKSAPTLFDRDKKMAELLSIGKKISDAYSRLTQFRGSIISGSVARGCCDAKSDIEMEIFYEDVLPTKKQITGIITALDGKLSRSKNVHWFHPAWGYHSFFVVDNIKIELGYREINETFQRMKEFCHKFKLPIHGIHDTPFGYYESGLASYFDESLIIEDTAGKIKKIKDLVSIYPEKIRIITTAYYFKDAKIFTTVKLRQAVERNDLFQFNSCLARVIRSLNICLFALNKKYFPGDKWNHLYIEKFLIKPQDYDEILKMVFSKSDYELFNKKAKYQLIKKLIAETEILIKKEGINLRKNWYE